LRTSFLFLHTHWTLNTTNFSNFFFFFFFFFFFSPGTTSNRPCPVPLEGNQRRELPGNCAIFTYKTVTKYRVLELINGGPYYVLRLADGLSRLLRVQHVYGGTVSQTAFYTTVSQTSRNHALGVLLHPNLFHVILLGSGLKWPQTVNLRWRITSQSPPCNARVSLEHSVTCIKYNYRQLS
jgi:hypothetical protein